MTQDHTLHPRAPQALLALSLLAAALSSPAAQAESFPVTTQQRATAQQVAKVGVPLSELAPNAPDEYTVKRGDTLWGVSRVFLKNPWRWPELWGMNLDEIRNPHLIFPGQRLVLDKSSGRAVLRRGGGAAAGSGTVKLSPRARSESLAAAAVPTISPEAIGPFLAEPLVTDEDTLKQAPRIVATPENRVLLGRNDRAYVRGESDKPVTLNDGQPARYRVFRDAKPLQDPKTGEILGYEAQYVGQAEVVRGEGTRADGDQGETRLVPATIDVVKAKEEMRVGDRMLPEPGPQPMTFTPHAPVSLIEATVVAVYGDTVRYASQNQVVAVNRGSRDGMEPGQVFALLKTGEQVVDKTDPARPVMQLPDERNGLAMVFRTFERVSYVLILETTDSVKKGDRLVNPD